MQGFIISQGLWRDYALHISTTSEKHRRQSVLPLMSQFGLHASDGGLPPTASRPSCRQPSADIPDGRFRIPLSHSQTFVKCL